MKKVRPRPPCTRHANKQIAPSQVKQGLVCDDRLQFEVAREIGDAMRCGDDVSVADESPAAFELRFRVARDEVAEVRQPRELTDCSILQDML